MNEITRIHLGRQAFVIAVDAHKELQEYLQAIKKQVGTKNADVLEEIETRMAELLVTERNAGGENVVLPADVTFLKEQLGEPKDFHEDDGEEPAGTSESGDAPRRLFRDTQHAMVAGVASGLAAYFGIDAVIVRLIFVVLTLISGGAGIIAYIVLWIVAPEAKTNSDRLQMRGKAVTVDSLKEIVDRADVEGAAKRASGFIAPLFRIVSRIILGIVGVGVITAAAAMLFAIVAAAVTAWTGHGQLAGQTLFPVGRAENTLLVAALAAVAAFAILLTLIGVAMISAKWKVSGWIIASLAGIFIVASGVGTVLALDAAPRIRDRYEAMRHTVRLTPGEFQDLSLKGDDTHFRFVSDAERYVEVSYLGNPAQSQLATAVDKGLLTIDTTTINKQRLCNAFCFYNNHDIEVTIHAPSVRQVNVDGLESSFDSTDRLNQDALALQVRQGSYAEVAYANPHEATFRFDDGSWQIKLSGLDKDAYRSDMVGLNTTAYISRAGSVSFETARQCEGEPLLFIASTPDTVSINGEKVPDWRERADAHRNDGPNFYSCLTSR